MEREGAVSTRLEGRIDVVKLLFGIDKFETPCRRLRRESHGTICGPSVALSVSILKLHKDWQQLPFQTDLLNNTLDGNMSVSFFGSS